MKQKSRASCQEEGAELGRAEVPLMIHSFNKYLLSTYYTPGTVLNAGTNTEEDRQSSCSQGADILLGQTIT